MNYYDNKPLIYIAAPYTSPDPEVSQTRLAAATILAANLIHEGHLVFSPLTYSQELKNAGHVFPTADDWYQYDIQYLMRCDRMLILRTPGWELSRGVNAEIIAAKRLGIPIDLDLPFNTRTVRADTTLANNPAPLRAPLIYLASPMAHSDPSIVAQRRQHAAHAAARHAAKNSTAFSPIVYTWTMQDNGLEPPQGHWYDFDCALQRRCDIVDVIPLEGWQDSIGVSLEIAQAQDAQQRLRFHNPEDPASGSPFTHPQVHSF